MPTGLVYGVMRLGLVQSGNCAMLYPIQPLYPQFRTWNAVKRLDSLCKVLEATNYTLMEELLLSTAPGSSVE